MRGLVQTGNGERAVQVAWRITDPAWPAVWLAHAADALAAHDSETARSRARVAVAHLDKLVLVQRDASAGPAGT